MNLIVSLLHLCPNLIKSSFVQVTNFQILSVTRLAAGGTRNRFRRLTANHGDSRIDFDNNLLAKLPSIVYRFYSSIITHIVIASSGSSTSESSRSSIESNSIHSAITSDVASSQLSVAILYSFAAANTNGAALTTVINTAVTTGQFTSWLRSNGFPAASVRITSILCYDRNYQHHHNPCLSF